MQTFQIGQDFQLALVVELGERLVHQQDPWRGEQGAGDGDVLALAAGKQGRHAFEEVADTEQFGDRGQREVLACG